MALLIDSYSESNFDGYYSVSWISGDNGIGQSITGDGRTLDSIKFYLAKTGSPTGYAYAKIYAHSGTFGTSSIPTGEPLAVSDGVDVSTFGLEGSETLFTFNFTGANKIILANGTKYVNTIEYLDGDWDNYINVCYDNSSPTHAGNLSEKWGDNWYAASTDDLCFYVYGDGLISVTGSLSLTGTIKRATAKTIIGILTFGGGLKELLQSVYGAITFVGNITQKAITITKTGIVTFSGSVLKSITKTITGIFVSTGIVIKSITKKVTGILTFTGIIQRGISKNPVGIVTFLGSITNKAIGKFITGILILTGTIQKAITKTVMGALILAGRVLKAGMYVELYGTVVFTGKIIKGMAVMLRGVLTFSGILGKLVWNRIARIVLSWTVISKAVASWTARTKPTTTWTEQEKQTTEWDDD